MSDIPYVAATAITDAHIRRNPHPDTSIAPPTAADAPVHVHASSQITRRAAARAAEPSEGDEDEDDDNEEEDHDDDEDDDDDDDEDNAADHVDLSNIDEESEYINSLSSSIVDYADEEGVVGRAAGGHMRRRRGTLPPLPDLRFEQSYLAGIRKAADEGRWGAVALITIRDQVVMPMLQGILWNLGLAGWRYWNRSARFKGANTGARIRRWWWDVNNWQYPKQ